jgi:hypothetical protein
MIPYLQRHFAGAFYSMKALFPTSSSSIVRSSLRSDLSRLAVNKLLFSGAGVIRWGSTRKKNSGKLRLATVNRPETGTGKIFFGLRRR